MPRNVGHPISIMAYDLRSKYVGTVFSTEPNISRRTLQFSCDSLCDMTVYRSWILEKDFRSYGHAFRRENRTRIVEFFWKCSVLVPKTVPTYFDRRSYDIIEIGWPTFLGTKPSAGYWKLCREAVQEGILKLARNLTLERNLTRNHVRCNRGTRGRIPT